MMHLNEFGINLMFRDERSSQHDWNRHSKESPSISPILTSPIMFCDKLFQTNKSFISTRQKVSDITPMLYQPRLMPIGHERSRPVSSCSSGVSSMTLSEGSGRSSGESLKKFKPVEKKLMYEGRNLLDLFSNLRDERWSDVQYAELPSFRQNTKFFLDNRSQYHRLGAEGICPLAITMARCNDCEFMVPIKTKVPDNYKLF